VQGLLSRQLEILCRLAQKEAIVATAVMQCQLAVVIL